MHAWCIQRPEEGIQSSPRGILIMSHDAAAVLLVASSNSRPGFTLSLSGCHHHCLWIRKRRSGRRPATLHSWNPWYQEFSRTELGRKPLLAGEPAVPQRKASRHWLSDTGSVGVMRTFGKWPGPCLGLLQGQLLKRDYFPHCKVIASEV